MKVVGFAGFSGAGKTTLVEQVVSLLRAAGHTVSVIKHAHSSFDVDKPGKDSYRHREAGAYEVMLVSKKRMALLREWQLEQAPAIDQLLKEMKPVDWVLVEGFKQAPIAKIEVWRADNEQPLRLMDDAHIIAIATDTPEALPATNQKPVLDINQPQQVVTYLMQHEARFEVKL